MRANTPKSEIYTWLCPQVYYYLFFLPAIYIDLVACHLEWKLNKPENVQFVFKQSDCKQVQDWTYFQSTKWLNQGSLLELTPSNVFHVIVVRYLKQNQIYVSYCFVQTLKQDNSF